MFKVPFYSKFLGKPMGMCVMLCIADIALLLHRLCGSVFDYLCCGVCESRMQFANEEVHPQTQLPRVTADTTRGQRQITAKGRHRQTRQTI